MLVKIWRSKDTKSLNLNKETDIAMFCVLSKCFQDSGKIRRTNTFGKVLCLWQTSNAAWVPGLDHRASQSVEVLLWRLGLTQLTRRLSWLFSRNDRLEQHVTLGSSSNNCHTMIYIMSVMSINVNYVMSFSATTIAVTIHRSLLATGPTELSFTQDICSLKSLSCSWLPIYVGPWSQATSEGSFFYSRFEFLNLNAA